MMLLFGIGNAQTPTPTPDVIREEVVVTANRTETRIGDTPASVVTFSRAEIESAASPTIDDILRQSAGFSIFRRSSSRNANPTTQGVSLRGVGASGASRSVILFDGVPLNDPFGGWVQWNRVTPLAVERIEVLRGGASSLYGSAGLSGAINIMPRTPIEKFTASADVFGGTQKTISGSGFAGFKSQGWIADATAASFQTRGFRPVDEAARGPVDVFAGMRSSNFTARLTRQVGDKATVFARPSYFGEVRTNGTGLQTNRTHIKQMAIGGDAAVTGLRLDWRLFGGLQVFDQVFTAINAPRTAESLTRIQRTPAQNSGISMQFRSTYRTHTFVGGFDLRDTRGSSDETAYANNQPTVLIGAGGREKVSGVFIQDFVRFGRKLVVAGSVRYDRWRNYAAFSSTRPLTTNPTATTAFPDRVEDAISPQLSALVHVSDQFSLYASASRSFRSPTLNELYRAFRVGNVLTRANENLRAERSNNIEGGVAFNRKRLLVRASGFWAGIERTVANVTLSSTPSLITRQRQNAGETTARGFELELETSLGPVSLTSGYLFADSRVSSFPSNVQLEGRMIPQVPRHQFTFQTRYASGKWSLAIQGRVSSAQFDDDLNLFRLEPYIQIDVFVARRLTEHLQIYTGIENLFNTRYSVGRTPTRTVNSPSGARVGIRWR